ncbi:MAG: tetratricopeptide repeat protein [Candidatus Marinimicrobia bacterium]|nr:tetratricopeptide repeat protein [Candidatus Neomarinimicrobiota bacterium]
MNSQENLKKQVADLMETGKFSEAIPVFQKILEADASDSEAWYYLAMARIELKNYEEAEKALAKALDLDKNNTDYLLQSGYLKHLQDNIEESKKIFHSILKIDPNNIDALHMLGLIAKDEEHYKEAIEFLIKSYDTDPDIDILINIVECYLDWGDLSNAEKYLAQLSEAKLDSEQSRQEREIAVRFYLDKAMSSWTGTTEEENGETLYYPETLDQVKSAEYYLQCAEKRQPEEEFYKNHLQQLKEVVAAHKQDLLNDSSHEKSVFTEEDNEAWKILDEIYSLWTYTEIQNDIEYHWPNSLEEVRLSKKLLKKAGKINFQAEDVRERIKAMAEILESTRSWLPNNSFKVLRALVLSIVTIAAVFFLMNYTTFKKPVFEYSASDWVVTEQTELAHDSFVEPHGKNLKHHILLNAGTQLTPLARMGTYWAQVETQSGQRGFIFFRNLKGAKNPVANRNAALYSDLSKQTVIDSVRMDERVSVLSYHRNENENIPYIAKVRNSKGKTGYIWDYELDYPFFEKLPEISQTTTFPTSAKNIEKLTEKNITDLENKFGPATSVLSVNNKKIAYFRQINIVKEQKKYRGIFFNLNVDNKVKGYDVGTETKTKFLEKLPFVSRMRDYELFTILGFSFYRENNKEASWWTNFKKINWITKVLGFLVSVIIGLTGIFLFFSMPRLIINPFMVLISYSRLLGNGLVLLLNFLLYGTATYIFFAAMALLMNQIFTPLLCAAPTFFIWWKIHSNNIQYNRCPSCNTMNVGIDKGSTFHGKTQHVTHGTYDVYKGTTETSTQIIKNYERRSKKTTEFIRHYTDHRECINCGYQWGVAREESEGSTTQYL